MVRNRPATAHHGQKASGAAPRGFRRTIRPPPRRADGPSAAYTSASRACRQVTLRRPRGIVQIMTSRRKSRRSSRRSRSGSSRTAPTPSGFEITTRGPSGSLGRGTVDGRLYGSRDDAEKAADRIAKLGIGGHSRSSLVIVPKYGPAPRRTAAGLSFHFPPSHQGQIVEVGYALTPAGVIERTFDRSDRRTSYRIHPWTAKLRRWDDPWNRPPAASSRWKRITGDEVDAIAEEMF